MAAAGAVTSPSILSAVTDPVPLLQFVSRDRPHPGDHTAALYFSPSNRDKKTQQEQGYAVLRLPLWCIHIIGYLKGSESISGVVKLVLDGGLR